MSERFTLQVDGVEIPTVLHRPEGSRVAVLLIPGSLNADVDGNFAPMFPGQPPMRPHVYLDLATQLEAEGITVLRFSKRGPGTGCVTHDEELAKERYREFGQRVRVASAFLDELVRRAPGLPLALAGHSEGSVVATLLAQQRADVKRLILLSGPALPLLRLMIWQRQQQAPVADTAYQQALDWAGDFAAGRSLTPATAGNPYGELFTFFQQPQAVDYLGSLERVEPAAELGKVAQPVLLVQGGRDTSVMEANVDLLKQAQPKAEVVRFPGLNHNYKPAPAGLDPQSSFNLDGTSDPAVARAMARWLARA